MGEVEQFVKILNEGGYSRVAFDTEGEIELIDINNLLNKIKKIGVNEVCDTYYEELGFIANDGKFIQVYAVY